MPWAGHLLTVQQGQPPAVSGARNVHQSRPAPVSVVVLSSKSRPHGAPWPNIEVTRRAETPAFVKDLTATPGAGAQD